MDIRSAIYRFCSYQERSHREVRDRLYELGADTGTVNGLLADLIERGLLNEERFAMSFARGKFRIKHWGRIRIIRELKMHRVSEYLIRKALKELEPNEYFETACRLAKKKWDSLAAERNDRVRTGKLYRYLLQKGYESSVIAEVIDAMKTLE